MTIKAFIVTSNTGTTINAAYAFDKEHRAKSQMRTLRMKYPDSETRCQIDEVIDIKVIDQINKELSDQGLQNV